MPQLGAGQQPPGPPGGVDTARDMSAEEKGEDQEENRDSEQISVQQVSRSKQHRVSPG